MTTVLYFSLPTAHVAKPTVNVKRLKLHVRYITEKFNEKNTPDIESLACIGNTAQTT